MTPEALAFYKRALGAETLYTSELPGGRSCTRTSGDSVVMLTEETLR